MNRNIAICCMSLVALGVAMSVSAHHSISMIEIGKPEWVTGTVVECRVQHPHVMFTLDVKAAGGQLTGNPCGARRQ